MLTLISLRKAGMPPFGRRPDLACKRPGLDPEVFFPDEHNRRYRLAKSLCRSCPAASECLAWALPIHDLDGVWGATTAEDRRLIRRMISRREYGDEA